MATENMIQGTEVYDESFADKYPGALLVYEAHGDEKVLFANQAMVNLFECENLEDFLSYTKASFRNIVHPEDLKRVEESIWSQIENQKKRAGDRVRYFDDCVDYRVITKKGNIITVEDTGRLVSSDRYGEVFYVCIVPHTDQEYRYKSVLSALSREYVSIIEADVLTNSVSAFKLHPATSPKVSEALAQGDYTYAQRVVTETSVAPSYQERFARLTSLEYIRKRLREVPNYSFIYKSNNGIYVGLKVVRADSATEGEPSAVIIGFADRDQETREKMASERDELTGLYNRRMYEKMLDDIRRTRPSTVCIICMDVNGLKYVNDNLGHQEGDAFIKGAADCILEAYGDIAACFRVGGDEFQAILLDAEIEGSDICNRVKEYAKRWKGNFSEKLTISVGMAAASVSDNKTLEELVEEADNRMYADKRLHYTQLGNELRKKDTGLTKSDLANKIAELRAMFDTVRVIDLEERKAIRYDDNGKEYYEHLNCFAVWNRHERCENCVSSQAMEDHGRHSKFEFKKDGVHLVFSQYLEVDGKPMLVEVIHKMDNSSMFDEFSSRQLETIIKKSNHRQCEEHR